MCSLIFIENFVHTNIYNFLTVEIKLPQLQSITKSSLESLKIMEKRRRRMLCKKFVGILENYGEKENENVVQF
jgi:hypothetical protein